jgi:diketogulonate reductase-like aldo/keto reductase
MPIIGLGTWRLQDTAKVVVEALNLGYKMIDTSGNYGTQPGIAQGLKRANVARDAFFLTTKVENDEDPMESLQRSLAELELEYVDLVLIHWPPEDGSAGEDLWEGLIKARDEGLTKDIGVSNYSAKLIDKLVNTTDEWPAVDQVEWTPFGHKLELLEYAKNKNMVVQAWSPLARTKQLDSPKLGSLAQKYGKSPAQVMLRWDVQLGIVPLPKAHSAEHLADNSDIFDFEIEEGDMQILNELNRNFSSLGSLHY